MLILDNPENPGETTQEYKGQFFTDGVMGGISSGKFNIEELSKSSSIFNYQKLDFLNNFYLQQEEGYEDFEKYIKNNDLIKSYLVENHKKISS